MSNYLVETLLIRLPTLATRRGFVEYPIFSEVVVA